MEIIKNTSNIKNFKSKDSFAEEYVNLLLEEVNFNDDFFVIKPEFSDLLRKVFNYNTYNSSTDLTKSGNFSSEILHILEISGFNKNFIHRIPSRKIVENIKKIENKIAKMEDIILDKINYYLNYNHTTIEDFHLSLKNNYGEKISTGRFYSFLGFLSKKDLEVFGEYVMIDDFCEKLRSRLGLNNHEDFNFIYGIKKETEPQETKNIWNTENENNEDEIGGAYLDEDYYKDENIKKEITNYNNTENNNNINIINNKFTDPEFNYMNNSVSQSQINQEEERIMRNSSTKTFNSEVNKSENSYLNSNSIRNFSENELKGSNINVINNNTNNEKYYKEKILVVKLPKEKDLEKEKEKNREYSLSDSLNKEEEEKENQSQSEKSIKSEKSEKTESTKYEYYNAISPVVYSGEMKIQIDSLENLHLHYEENEFISLLKNNSEIILVLKTKETKEKVIKKSKPGVFKSKVKLNSKEKLNLKNLCLQFLWGFRLPIKSIRVVSILFWS